MSAAARHRYLPRQAVRAAKRALLSPEATPDEKDEARQTLLAACQRRGRTVAHIAARALQQDPARFS